jgi:hypothetical protein
MRALGGGPRLGRLRRLELCLSFDGSECVDRAGSRQGARALDPDEGPGDETIVGDVEQWRNVVWIFDQKSSDPRLTGTVETRYSVDLRPDGSGELWGTLVIRNDEGTWEGEWTGTIARGGTTHYILGEASGTGAYKGLTYHLQGHFLEKSGEGFAPGTDVVISGWIEKAE